MDTVAPSTATMVSWPHFIIMPGAGGSLPTIPQQSGNTVTFDSILKPLGSTDVIEGITGGNGVRRRTLCALLSRIDVASSRKIFLVGHSFGCRNIAHLMVGQVEKLSKAEAKEGHSLKFDTTDKLGTIGGLVLIGYPTRNTKGEASERLKIFLRLWRRAHVPILLIKGECDDDITTFKDVVYKCEKDGKPPAARHVHYVHDGGHNPFRRAKKPAVACPVHEHENEIRRASILSVITAFVTSPSEGRE